MTYCLGISTVGKDCSVCFGRVRGNKIDNLVEVVEFLPSRGHDQAVFLLLERLSSAVHLGMVEKVVVSEGPGSFTGVRIGVAVAEGLAIAKNLEVVKVCSLQSIVRQGLRERSKQTVDIRLHSNLPSETEIREKCVVAGIMPNGIGGYYCRKFNGFGEALDAVQSLSMASLAEYLSGGATHIFAVEDVAGLGNLAPGYTISFLKSSSLLNAILHQ